MPTMKPIAVAQGLRHAGLNPLAPIDQEGKKRIRQSRVAVIGMGDLGIAIASQLCRAGVGHLRLIDRDYVQLSDLKGRVPFDADDAQLRMPKAIAAAGKLSTINSEVKIEPLVADVTCSSVEEIVRDCDMLLDGAGSWETRCLLNEACIKLGVPWVYGEAVGSRGSTMAIVPGVTPCLRCLMAAATGPDETSDGNGVLPITTATVADLQFAESLRLLVGLPPTCSATFIDLREREFHNRRIERRHDCQTCGQHRYDYLTGGRKAWTTVRRGRDRVQIESDEQSPLPLAHMGSRLRRVAEVTFNGHLLSVRTDGQEIVIFPNGRAIVDGAADVHAARALYAKCIGRQPLPTAFSI